MSFLDDQFDEVMKLVAGALDVEAGLRDAMLPDQFELLGKAVHAALDVEAGLRDILPDAGFASPAETWVDRFVLDLTRLSPGARLRLRTGMELSDLESIDILARAWEACQLVTDSLASVEFDYVGTKDQEKILFADGLARRLSDSLSRVAGGELTSEARLALRLRNDIELALAHTHPDGSHVLKKALVGALNLAMNLLEALYFALIGGGPHFGATTSRDLDELLSTAPLAARSKIVAALRMLVRMVTDFTDVDLFDLDLYVVDLRGTQWSELTTRWPPDWEGVVREASVQIDPDGRPDLYEVKDDPRLRNTVN